MKIVNIPTKKSKTRLEWWYRGTQLAFFLNSFCLAVSETWQIFRPSPLLSGSSISYVSPKTLFSFKAGLLYSITPYPVLWLVEVGWWPVARWRRGYTKVTVHHGADRETEVEPANLKVAWTEVGVNSSATHVAGGTALANVGFQSPSIQTEWVTHLIFTVLSRRHCV